MEDDIGGIVLLAVILPLAIWLITRPSSHLGQPPRTLAWVSPVSWIIFGLVGVWLVRKLLWPILGW